MRVEVYWNLRKGCYSVRDCKTGRVVEHTNRVTTLTQVPVNFNSHFLLLSFLHP